MYIYVNVCMHNELHMYNKFNKVLINAVYPK